MSLRYLAHAEELWKADLIAIVIFLMFALPVLLHTAEYRGSWRRSAPTSPPVVNGPFRAAFAQLVLGLGLSAPIFGIPLLRASSDQVPDGVTNVLAICVLYTATCLGWSLVTFQRGVLITQGHIGVWGRAWATLVVLLACVISVTGVVVGQFF